MSENTTTEAKAQRLNTMSDGKAPISTRFEYDETPYIGDKRFATPTNRNIYNTLRPGQVVLGTTVYNPQPSDIEQERVFGKREYNEKPQPESLHVTRQRLHDQELEIQELRSTLKAFMSGMATQVPAKPSAPVAVPEPVAAAPNVLDRTPTKHKRKR